MTDRRRTAYLAVLILVASCHEMPTRPELRNEGGRAVPGRRSVLDEMIDRAYYTCCVLRFDHDGAAYDANYNYIGGITVPAGTRVKVLGAAQHSLAFAPVEHPSEKLRLEFRFGTEYWPAEKYFHAILREDDPRTQMTDTSPDVASAIAKGRLMVGTTKAQALMARGYPPMHHTRGVESDEWVYYETRGLVTRVTFANRRIEAMEAGAPP